MKKILIYVDSMAPAGGIERVISNLTNQWAKNYEVTILTKDSNESFYNLSKNIKMKSINRPLKLNMSSKISRILQLIRSLLSTHFELKKFIKEYDPDYIYTANPLNSLEVFILGKKNKRRLIISEHGSKFGYNKIYNFIKKIIYPNVYKLSVPTTMDTELYSKEGCPAVYIPHIYTFKAEKNNDLQSKTVLNIGRLTSDKQQLKLLKIWNILYSNKRIDGWKLKIVGTGEELGNLKDYIYKNKLDESVEILNPVRDIDKIFRQASIFAFTSRYEGFGMVLLEAMAFGIPCISFDCPSGPRDIIIDEKNGFLIEENDLNEFADKLYLLMNDDQLRGKMGVKAFRTVENWDNEEIITKWNQLFKCN